MKSMRLITVLFLIPVITLLQSCGSGGGTSDTAGSLTLSAATVSDGGTDANGITYSLLTVTATYAPPAGKSAQGVVVDISATDSLGNVSTGNITLTSGSNSRALSLRFPQQLNATTQVFIEASIGGMKSSVFAIVPMATVPTLTVTTSTVDFLITDIATLSKNVSFSGGVKPYTVSSNAPSDISSIISSTNSSTSGGVLQITLLNTNIGGVASTATVTLNDSNGASVPITVNYFK